jgi:hypothetical protein
MMLARSPHRSLLKLGGEDASAFVVFRSDREETDTRSVGDRSAANAKNDTHDPRRPVVGLGGETAAVDNIKELHSAVSR